MQRIKWIWFWKRKWIIETLLEEDDKYIIYDQIDKSWTIYCLFIFENKLLLTKYAISLL